MSIALDKRFSALLTRHGVAVAGNAPSLPIRAGMVDPAAGQAELAVSGSLQFKRGGRSVIFRKITLKSRPAPLVAKVGGGQLKVATGKLRSARAGFGTRFAASRLELTEKVATRLSKKLALRDVFQKGQAFASVRATAQPATLAILPTGRASFTPDPAFKAKLDSLFVSANPIAPAELSPGPLFTLPFIPAGTIAPDGTGGVPRTGGSLEFLQLGSGQIFWHELWLDLAARQVLAEVDIEPTPTFPGKLGQVPILDLGPGSVFAEPAARTVALAGAALSLNGQGAASFNQAFAAGKPAFSAGEAIGTLSFTAHTQ